jgi:hypothetical protein
VAVNVEAIRILKAIIRPVCDYPTYQAGCCAGVNCAKHVCDPVLPR